MNEPSDRRPVPLVPDPFPPVHPTTPDVVAVGGDPEPALLLAAYRRGIFPWPHEGYPLPWFCPDPRFVLEPERTHLSRSLRRRMRKGPHDGGFEVRADTAFDAVMAACATVPRPGQSGTWITEDLRAGFSALHRLGLAHSVESWRDDRLVGGIYGVALGRVFFGESMFAHESDASKVALATLLGNLAHWGFALLDCQAPTEHMERFGAEEWSREEFLELIETAVEAPTRRGGWRLELGPAEVVGVLRG